VSYLIIKNHLEKGRIDMTIIEYEDKRSKGKVKNKKKCKECHKFYPLSDFVEDPYRKKK
jgi:hypothetical protein